MKARNAVMFFFIIFSVSCTEKNTKSSSTTNLSSAEPQHNFDWLFGSWIRINGQEGSSTFENWKKQNDTEYIGFGYTMQDKDTVWQEHIIFHKTDSIWSFNVTGIEGEESTNFKLTEIGEKSFTCENPENEFPKVISYSKKGEQLVAKISGNDMEVDFVFEKTNKD